MSIETGLIVIALALVVGYFLVTVRSRRERQDFGRTSEKMPTPRQPKSKHPENGEDDPEPLTMGKRIGAIAFLSFWLSIWSVGCYFALVTRVGMQYGEEGFIFLTIWLGVAIPAWFFVAWTLLRLLRGDHVDIRFDGDGDGDGGD